MSPVFFTLVTVIDGQPVQSCVRGRIVTAGLAVTDVIEHGRPIPGLAMIFHMASGRPISTLAYCHDHIGAAVAAALNSGIDWTLPLADIHLDQRWESTELDLELWTACTHQRAI